MARLAIDDVDDLLRWANDRTLNEMTGAWPVPPDRDRMTSLVAGWLLDPTIRAFTIRLDGHRIGNCWLGHIESRSATLGMSIGNAECWGKGYGADAIRLLLHEARDFERVTLWAYADNERAARTYRRVGFVETGRGKHHGRETIEMERLGDQLRDSSVPIS